MKFIVYATLANTDVHKRLEIEAPERAQAIRLAYMAVPRATAVSCRPQDPGVPDRRLTGPMALGA